MEEECLEVAHYPTISSFLFLEHSVDRGVFGSCTLSYNLSIQWKAGLWKFFLQIDIRRGRIT